MGENSNPIRVGGCHSGRPSAVPKDQNRDVLMAKNRSAWSDDFLASIVIRALAFFIFLTDIRHQLASIQRWLARAIADCFEETDLDQCELNACQISSTPPGQPKVLAFLQPFTNHTNLNLDEYHDFLVRYRQVISNTPSQIEASHGVTCSILNCVHII